MLKKVEQRFLHHVGHLESLERRPDEDNRSHRWNHFVRWNSLGLVKKYKKSLSLFPNLLLKGRVPKAALLSTELNQIVSRSTSEIKFLAVKLLTACCYDDDVSILVN